MVFLVFLVVVVLVIIGLWLVDWCRLEVGCVFLDWMFELIVFLFCGCQFVDVIGFVCILLYVLFGDGDWQWLVGWLVMWLLDVGVVFLDIQVGVWLELILGDESGVWFWFLVEDFGDGFLCVMLVDFLVENVGIVVDLLLLGVMENEFEILWLIMDYLLMLVWCQDVLGQVIWVNLVYLYLMDVVLDGQMVWFLL